MKTKKILILIIIPFLVLFASCVKNSRSSKDQTQITEKFDLQPLEKRLLTAEEELEEAKKSPKTTQNLTREEKKVKQAERLLKRKQKALEKKQKRIKKTKENKKNNKKHDELDFYVKNTTGKTIYVTCFSYIKKQNFVRWKWDKSPIYEIPNQQLAKIDVDYIPDPQNRENVYAYLAVMNTFEQADLATYETLNDKYKIDIDQLYKLQDKKVVIGVERYGIQGELLDYDIAPLTNHQEKHPELDFVVYNNTGKTVLITCFAYQIKEDTKVWRYDKTPLIKLENHEYGLIDVDTIAKPYDRVYIRGYLAVFDINQKEEAKNSTFELLKPENKITLGRLAALKNKKIILDIEKYGEIGNKIDFTVQPIRRIDFKKALNLE